MKLCYKKCEVDLIDPNIVKSRKSKRRITLKSKKQWYKS